MRIIDNFDLTDYNAYKLKAICSRAFFPDNEDNLIEIYRNFTGTKKVLLGNGNNVILSKEYFNEEFIIFNNCFDKIEVSGNQISAEAGATTLQLSEITLKHCLSGFEIFYDIPSSIGGAVVMNAGASGEEIKDVLINVRYLDLHSMQITEITKEEIGFEYRNSFFQKNTDKIVLKAWFILKPGSQEQIKAKMETSKETRWAKQPREYPNCGSVFKRPKGFYVGTMIQELGLKGYTQGGAQISEKHGGFIINRDNATGKDILDIIKVVKEKVYTKFGVDLEIEQRII